MKNLVEEDLEEELGDAVDAGPTEEPGDEADVDTIQDLGEDLDVDVDESNACTPTWRVRCRALDHGHRE